MSHIPQNEQNVIDFLTKLRANWGKRFDDERSEQLWLDQMIDELKGYDGEVLKDAARNLLRKKLQGFPRLAECVEVCNEAKRWIDGRKPKLPMGADAGDREAGWLGRYETLADSLITGPEGREAARDGYVTSLWQFIGRQGRLPSPGEKAKIITGARETDELYAAMLRGTQRSGNAGLDAICLLAVEGMLAKREEMRARVLGAEADR